MTNIYPIILAGGSGTRLWPFSRKTYPKQFLKFAGEYSLLQQAVLRNDVWQRDSIILTADDLRFIVARQLEEIDKKSRIILEPEIKETLPVALLIALILQKEDRDALLLISPSDHLIKDPLNYQQLVNKSANLAKSGKLVTFGITAKFPHTGYGYIEKGEGLADGLFAVKKFHEKPNKERAEEYVKSTNYLWNSGIFLFSACSLIDEVSKVDPDLLSIAKQVANSFEVQNEYFAFDPELFAKLKRISIDYGLLEKTDNIAVCEADIDWNDLGSWKAIADISEKDEKGNIYPKNERAWVKDCENIVVQSDNDRLITCLGVKDITLVNTDDAILLIDNKQTERVKEIVGDLQQADCQEIVYHTTTHRPWGYYRILNEAKNHKTKELTLYPGKSISLQYHHKRAEHWVVVEGEARVIKGEEEFVLKENESVYIPKTVKHQLINDKQTELKIIEVQTGEYLGEDDIVRIG